MVRKCEKPSENNVFVDSQYFVYTTGGASKHNVISTFSIVTNALENKLIACCK